MFRAGLWCAVALMAGGCLEATKRSVGETIPTTTGLTEQQILDGYGSPDRVTPMPEGRELEYMVTKDRQTRGRCYITFVLDGAGILRSYKYSGGCVR
jgi:hypothetical protein